MCQSIATPVTNVLLTANWLPAGLPVTCQELNVPSLLRHRRSLCSSPLKSDAVCVCVGELVSLTVKLVATPRERAGRRYSIPD